MSWRMGRDLWRALDDQVPRRVRAKIKAGATLTAAERKIVEDAREVRRVAARSFAGIMGMTSLFSGMMGLPIINVIAFVANAVHLAAGDDDEPWDFETEFRQWLAEHFGKDGARLIADGPTNMLTGANIASRVSLSNLWFRDVDRQLEGRDAYYRALESIAGPLGGLIKGMYVGTQDIAEGHTWRGVERMLPTAVKNGMKGLRFAHEGVNTMRGDPIITDPSTAENILQGLGFQPTRLAEQWRENSAVYNYKDQIINRRRSLMNAFAMTVYANDGEARTSVLRKIRAFNRKHPSAPISTDSLRRSLRGRAVYSARAEHGVVLPKRIAAEVRADVGVSARE
ncbi:MAG: PLxRFG domain-containing protein, partial [Salinisphaera sp.]|nr:PLxRFG domain-containing protein [Salinisphaera sp.]